MDVTTRSTGSTSSARFTGATDAELVRAAAAGDRDAVAVVWDRYAGLSRYCLRRRTGFGVNVEDLLQDVFVAFLASVRRIRNQDSLRAYLTAIAGTLATQAVRHDRRRRLVSLDDTEEVVEIAAPPSDFEGRELLLALERALDGMPLRVRLVYSLFHFAGLKLSEIARRLGVSVSTAKRAFSRARKRLHGQGFLGGDLAAASFM